MPYLVFATEIAAVLCIGAFCLMLASDGLRGRVFEIPTKDPVGRFLIRNAQVAFTLGYGIFFLFSAFEAAGTF